MIVAKEETEEKQPDEKTRPKRTGLRCLLLLGLPLIEIFFRAESTALKERVNWISENVDPYNMKAMGRLLPKLRLYDEEAHQTQQLAQKVKQRLPVAQTTLTFRDAMGDTFVKWIKKIKKESENELLIKVLEIQMEKKVPTYHLIALASLCRVQLLDSADAKNPLCWIYGALEKYQEGLFHIANPISHGLLKKVLIQSNVPLDKTGATLNFSEHTYSQWINKDLVCKLLEQESEDKQIEIKDLVTLNISRDTVIERLLDNPKVFNRPGTVAYIAQLTRSASVLSKIASRPELHSGPSNKEVPMEIILNPTKISMLLLRPFLSTRMISLTDLRSLVKQKNRVRPEVYVEILRYLKSRGEKLTV